MALDKLTPREDPDSKSPPKSPKRDGNVRVNLKSRIEDTVMPSFLKGKNEQKFKIDQRVVTFIKDYPARGRVLCISEEKDGQRS